MADSGALNSWKEIANYMGRSVRTVQRWEVILSFPVRRLNGRDHGSVMALPAEIDAWLASRPLRPGAVFDPTSREKLHATLRKNVEKAREVSAAALELQDRVKDLQDKMEMIRSRQNGQQGNLKSMRATGAQ